MLIGGGGRDVLSGGTGFDRLIGGELADVFEFSIRQGTDLIRDFGGGNDKIDVSDFGFADAQAVLDGGVPEGRRRGFNLGFGTRIVMEDHVVADFDGTEFIL